eukprot:153396-Prymnesium_polylepis.1
MPTPALRSRTPVSTSMQRLELRSRAFLTRRTDGMVRVGHLAISGVGHNNGRFHRGRRDGT